MVICSWAHVLNLRYGQANTCVLLGGRPEQGNPQYDTYISSDNGGGLVLYNTYTVYNAQDRQITLEPTKPEPISVKIDIYGIN